MDRNNRIFERVKDSLTQNRKNLSPEDLEVVKCIFAALVAGVAAGNERDAYSTASKLLKIAERFGFIENPSSCD